MCVSCVLGWLPISDYLLDHSFLVWCTEHVRIMYIYIHWESEKEEIQFLRNETARCWYILRVWRIARRRHRKKHNVFLLPQCRWIAEWMRQTIQLNHERQLLEQAHCRQLAKQRAARDEVCRGSGIWACTLSALFLPWYLTNSRTYSYIARPDSKECVLHCVNIRSNSRQDSRTYSGFDSTLHVW